MGGILTPKNTKTTSSTQLPSYITSAYQQSLGQASNASSQPFNYNGELAAGASPLQQAAYAGLPGAVNAAQPYIDQAAGLTAAGTTPLNVTPFTAANLQQYENPYTSDVIDATQKQFALGNAEQQSQLVGNAASQHALGGDRVAVAQAELAKQQAATQNPIIAGLNSQNYQQAQNEFNTQQQTGLAAQEAQNYTNLYGAGEYGNLGQLAQGSQLSGLGAELNAGSQQQATQQNADTLQYQKYLTQLGYPLQQAQSLAQIAASFAPSTGTTTQTKPGSSLLGSIAGLGLSAAGLGMFGPVDSIIPSIFGGRGGGYSSPGNDPGFSKQGGSIGSYADGGELDDEENDSDGDDPAGIGEETLAGLAASPEPETITSSAQSPSPPSPGGMSPINEALLTAGLGTLASNGRPLEMIGQGGLRGVAAYDSALKRQQQEQALKAQADYRASMSQAATTRAEAMSKHYENADNKPQVIGTGKTFQVFHPSDNSFIDTGIPTAAGQNAESGAVRAAAAKSQAATAAARLQNLIKTGGAGAGGVFGFKLKAAKSAGMSDAEALQFAGGHKEMSAADARKYAMAQATAAANANKDSFDNIDAYNAYRQQAFHDNLGILMGGTDEGTTQAPAANTPPPGPAATPPVAPKLPPGVPPGSLYSPSRKQYKDAQGNVYDLTGKKVSGATAPVLPAT